MAPTSSNEPRRIPLDRGVTACRVRGSLDAERIVLVFGGFHFPRNCDAFFDELAGELGPGYAVVTYDYWGRGDSEAPRMSYDAEAYLTQADGLSAALGLDTRRVVVLGYSFGGAVATRFAHRYPDRVEALILSGAYMTWAPVPPLVRALCRPGLRWIPWLAWWPAARKAILEGFADPSVAGPYVERMIATERAIVARDPAGFRRAILDTMGRFPTDGAAVVRELGAHPRPVLLVWGEKDNVSPADEARAIHAAMPRSRLVLVPGSHNDVWLVPDMAARLRAELASFLRARDAV